MLESEEGWDERGRGLEKETSRARIQQDYRPETLESNETWTQRDDRVSGKVREHRKDNRGFGIIFGRKYDAKAHGSIGFV